MYARVSTARQAGEERQSLPAQREAYVRWCALHDYEQGDVYSDADSGRREAREGYQRLLADAAAHRFDVIVVTYLDRFGRNDEEITYRVLELRRQGVKVEPTEETIPGFIELVLSAWKAGQESKRIGERVKMTMARSAREGKWQGGPPPYGYVVESKRLVIQPFE